MKNPRYKPNKKNGGNIPEMRDARLGFVPVRCGVCMECMAAKSAEWKARLLEEIKYNKQKGNFVTLTFSNESYKEIVEAVLNKNPSIEGYDLDNQVATVAVHRWRERWRKETGKSPRHWLITELGGGETEHLHLHGIVWGETALIGKHWGYGFATIGDGKGRNFVNEQTIGYITKYITKLDEKHKYYQPKILCSNQPGIGKGFVDTMNAKACKFKGDKTKTTYTTPQGFNMNLNVYWRNKLYTEEERELLWLQKLDEGVQYIGGEKIKAEDSENRAKLLKYYQNVSKKLGYGSPGDWEARKYEEQRRKLMQDKRLKVEEEKEEEPAAPKASSWEDRVREPGLDDW